MHLRVRVFVIRLDYHHQRQRRLIRVTLFGCREHFSADFFAIFEEAVMVVCVY
jgi:hypothetical protein